MSKSKKARHARLQRNAATRTPGTASFHQQLKRGGLLVTDELQKALEECKERVAEIAADCRRKNRKFRDLEFDLERDTYRCLQGLAESSDTSYTPSDVQRATQIFEKTSFFIDGADSNDIVQGELGDCWFLSALATMSTAKGLVEKFCVARDEQVGIYGFIFFRDAAWVTVIIDDLLYTSIPKFEELKLSERQLYHNDKEAFNKSARKNGKSLYFAKSGTHGETWVPLIEKAFAKLHGNYAALSGGEAGEAIEDLTGGVTSFIYTKDILDPDAFWTNELRLANTDRLFGCAYDALDNTRSGAASTTVNGLMGGHAYSILRAVEFKGKRFLVIRNPWGQCEWTGPWSDGSKEWTPEWLAALPVLGHAFGDDGQFVMEYKDFLENWEQIDRTLLFDSTWIMSSQWLKVSARPLPSPWSYGDVSFTISLPVASSTIIVLSKLDERFWKSISGRAKWSLDFIIYKKGESKPITTSSPSLLYSRSVNTEIFLEAGEYVVHVRLDRIIVRPENYIEEGQKLWQERIFSRVLTEQAKSQSIASNFDPVEDAHAQYLPVPLDLLAGHDLSEIEAKVAEVQKLKEQEARATAEAKAKTETPAKPKTENTDSEPAKLGVVAEDSTAKSTAKREGVDTNEGDDTEGEGEEVESGEGEGEEGEGEAEHDGEGEEEGEGEGSGPERTTDAAEDNIVYLGLRVYTNKAAPAKIGGQLRHTSLAGLLNKHGNSVEPVVV